MTGYKQPPTQTRFKKGQSGNPKGRPKKTVAAAHRRKSANALALDEAERLILVREGEETRNMPVIQAVYRAQAKAALGGNAFAQKDFVKRYGEAEDQRRSQIADDCEFWEGYIARTQKVLAEAKEKGEPLPTLYPHPDDVVINHKKGVTIEGPIDEKEANELATNLRLRDLYFMQGELDRRSWAKRDSLEPESELSSAWILRQQLDETMVPGRLRLSDSELISRAMRYRCMTKRTLLKELYQGWRSIGIPAKRGRIFPRASEVWPQVMEAISKRSGLGQVAYGEPEAGK